MNGQRKRPLGLDSDRHSTDDKKKCTLFGNLTFHLHPAALSKTRKELFEKKISENGGRLVQSVAEKVETDLYVLMEDKMMDVDKRQGLLEKLDASVQKENQMTILGLSWLSQCLEESEVVALDPYVLKVPKKVTEAKKEVLAKDSNNEKSSYIERNKHKFVCAKSSAEKATSSNPNKLITDELEKLAAAYKSTNDTWRAFGYQKAISALKNYPTRITSREEASKIPNVGKKMADKIMEIVEEGQLQKVSEVCDSDKMKVLCLFNRVWGVGPSTAEKWYQQGHRTLKDLEQKGNLSKQQLIGLKHFEDFDERMLREECTLIYETVKQRAILIQEGRSYGSCFH